MCFDLLKNSLNLFYGKCMEVSLENLHVDIWGLKCYYVSMCSISNWNLEALGFKKSGKLEYPEKNLSEQGKEPTTNSTYIASNLGHIGGR